MMYIENTFKTRKFSAYMREHGCSDINFPIIFLIWPLWVPDGITRQREAGAAGTDFIVGTALVPCCQHS